MFGVSDFGLGLESFRSRRRFFSCGERVGFLVFLSGFGDWSSDFVFVYFWSKLF